MVHLSLEPKVMDKLAAAAVLAGRSMGDEITSRIERSFARERAEPREWR